MIAGPLGLVALMAAVITAEGGDDGSPLRHLYLLPVLWAALARGAAGGAMVGLLAGLLQALAVFALIERVGLSRPAARFFVTPRRMTPRRAYHCTGRLVRPPVSVPDRTRSCSTGTASRIVGKRASSWEKTACSSMRASGAPRQ